MVHVPDGTVDEVEVQAAKQRLLDATIEYVAENGLGDLSLRQLAAAIGTSHRMLIYHFGSKEELLVEVVRAVEKRELAAMTALDLEEDGDESELMRRIWKRLSDPRMWPHERLFFDVYTNALAHDTDASEQFLDEVMERWIVPVARELTRRRGVTMNAARAEARLRLAVVRGLLLDLLATGDRAGVNRAHERFIAMCEQS
jgi:AcrR family transcriptional regulator